ncbi:sensor histidine kinase [Rhizobium cremeum]|uniref:sensor histidine kinase n=1 Tax=Rhizobium cremeum TaxID=2813827 RepID=UPI000DE0F4DA|nr:sensor histidine kinase [Rhizobium cremeum]MCJ7997093.1 sensor histidine kinase [Rhizobium cremeum]MCJ8002311.1 sensor histidine kinase [Rhizobium cremeum]
MNRLSRLFPTASLSVYLVAMAVLSTVPLLAFVVFLLTELERNEYNALKREVALDAQTIAGNFERKLEDMATTLRLLSRASELRAGDLAAFHARTSDSLGVGSLYVLLVNADGAQKLNTRVPYGTPLAKTSNVEAVRSAIAAGHPLVSGIFFGATAKQWVFNVTMPLPAELSAIADVIVLTQNAGDLASMTATDGLPNGWSAALLDADGKVIVSSGPDNIPSAQPFPEPMLRLMTGSNSSAVLREGEARTMLGYARVGEWSWRVAVWGPVSAAQTSIVSTWRQLIMGSVVLLGISLGIVLIAGQQLRRSIRQIARMAERIGHGEIVSPEITKVKEANQVSIALSNASFDRAQAEERVHFILQELVHRTKNILSLVQAMMRQLARNTDNVEEFQKAVSSRLAGLAQSIEALAKQEWGGIPIATVIKLQLATVTGDSARIELRGEDFLANANAVQNLGLVFHELATNSVKYGALSVPEGHIVVQWERFADENEEVGLRFRWSESGGPPVVRPSRRGFGTTVIERHAASAFGGKVTIDFDEKGLRWTLTAPFAAFQSKRGLSDHSGS